METLEATMTLQERVAEFRERCKKLTTKERVVVDAIIEGEGNRQIAERLGICVRTVESRRAQVREKLGVETAAELGYRFGEMRAVNELDSEYNLSPAAVREVCGG